MIFQSKDVVGDAMATIITPIPAIVDHKNWNHIIKKDLTLYAQHKHLKLERSGITYEYQYGWCWFGQKEEKKESANLRKWAQLSF